ncbi:transposase [Methylohalobius crimeensis]|uniref:transposase n=1 Tax=Methylohalobius crimeensis TaxID=244365 RepID=UPI0003B596B5|nr:transposase [Methylohalobius crimeensis]
MAYDPDLHHRRTIRLPGYDYSRAGSYFVTICTRNRECLFGDIVDGEMRLNEAGQIVAEEWMKTAEIRDEIELDEWVIMPNHIHGVVVISDGASLSQRCCRGDRPVAPTIRRRGSPKGQQSRSISAVVAGFKSVATKRINVLRQTPGAVLWQRNYYEHIIRDEESLNRIRQYIAVNPMNWPDDPENPGP